MTQIFIGFKKVQKIKIWLKDFIERKKERKKETYEEDGICPKERRAENVRKIIEICDETGNLREKEGEKGWLVGWLVVFYDISTHVGHLNPNCVYTYSLNIYDLKRNFQTIQSSHF